MVALRSRGTCGDRWAKTRTKVVGFQILAGTHGRDAERIASWCGVRCRALPRAAPQACYEVLAAWKDGDEGLAEEKQARLADAAGSGGRGDGRGGHQVWLRPEWIFWGLPRLPLLPLTGAERAEIEGLMQGMRH